jgi:transcriptional regulator with XRE-family HTH domain
MNSKDSSDSNSADNKQPEKPATPRSKKPRATGTSQVKPGGKKHAATGDKPAKKKRVGENESAKSGTSANDKQSSSGARSQTASGEDPLGSLLGGLADLTSTALQVAAKTGAQAGKMFDSLVEGADKAPERLKAMAVAGESLRDMRKVAGLTLADISSALDIKDKSFMEAVENGRETLTLEMIMRLASLYARNDPIPFFMRYLRTYKPGMWKIMESWGLDTLSLTVERERQFLNLYRRRDIARQLSEESFEKVLEFTGQAFDMSVELLAAEEKAEEEKMRDEEELFDETIKGDEQDEDAGKNE